MEGASQGKGMGNQFLDSVSDLNAIVNLVNPMGDDGKPLTPEGIEKAASETENEIFTWFASRISRDWQRFAKKEDATDSPLDEKLITKMSFFGINREQIKIVLSRESFPHGLSAWSEDDFMNFSRSVFKHIKPVIRVVNKGDLIHDVNTMERLPEMGYSIISADYELSIWKALNHGLIDSPESIKPKENASSAQKNALSQISSLFSSGKILRISSMFSRIIYDYLQYIVVYPVYDESKWTDKKGKVLPDAFLMKHSSTAEDLAYMIHTDIGEGFIRAVDGRTRMILGRNYELKDRDVIRIVSKTK